MRMDNGGNARCKEGINMLDSGNVWVGDFRILHVQRISSFWYRVWRNITKRITKDELCDVLLSAMCTTLGHIRWACLSFRVDAPSSSEWFMTKRNLRAGFPEHHFWRARLLSKHWMHVIQYRVGRNHRPKYSHFLRVWTTKYILRVAFQETRSATVQLHSNCFEYSRFPPYSFDRVSSAANWANPKNGIKFVHFWQRENGKRDFKNLNLQVRTRFKLPVGSVDDLMRSERWLAKVIARLLENSMIQLFSTKRIPEPLVQEQNCRLHDSSGIANRPSAGPVLRNVVKMHADILFLLLVYSSCLPISPSEYRDLRSSPGKRKI